MTEINQEQTPAPGWRDPTRGLFYVDASLETRIAYTRKLGAGQNSRTNRTRVSERRGYVDARTAVGSPKVELHLPKSSSIELAKRIARAVSKRRGYVERLRKQLRVPTVLIGTQSGFLAVISDVAQKVSKLLFTADQMVKLFDLPKLSALVELKLI